MNFWLSTTMLAAFLISATAAYLAVRALQVLKLRKAKIDHGGEVIKIPMALLQKRSLWNIVTIATGVSTIMWLFKGHAVTDFFQNEEFRITLTGVIMVTLGISVLLMLPTSRKSRWSKLLDERDRLVLSRATNFQVVGIMILGFVWTIGLTELYWEAGTIPIDIPYLVLWSQFLMLFLSRSIGIVYGYWWLDHYGD